MKNLDLIVYIGPGEKIPGSMYGPLVRPNEKYVCIDLTEGSNIHPFAKSGVKIYQKLSDDLKQDVKFIGSDANDIPLKDSCAFEVRMYNVMSDPDVHNKMRFLLEARRILRQGGCLSLAETYSPEVFPVNHAHSYTRHLNFYPRIVFDGADDLSKAQYLDEKMGGIKFLQPNSYMIEAIKK
jgi:ubiquinone/menaquinone biosynthesis C-methylase UbiE